MRWPALMLLLAAGFVSCKGPEHQPSSTTQEVRPAAPATPDRNITPKVSPNTRMASFGKAKKHLAEIHADHRSTLYCGCSFDDAGVVDRASCGYVPVSEGVRSRRVEWEHVVPAQAFGQAFPAWRDGHPECVDRRGKAFRGRPCARKVSEAFRYMEADMYNLQPAVGEVNERRGTATPAMIPGEDRPFGTCDFEVADGKMEPRPSVRGDIARTYLYMDQAYPGRGVVSRKNRPLFEAWAAQDPVDRWECERARRIARVQGNVNHVVELACRDAQL